VPQQEPNAHMQQQQHTEPPHVTMPTCDTDVGEGEFDSCLRCWFIMGIVTTGCSCVLIGIGFLPTIWLPTMFPWLLLSFSSTLIASIISCCGVCCTQGSKTQPRIRQWGIIMAIVFGLQLIATIGCLATSYPAAAGTCEETRTCYSTSCTTAPSCDNDYTNCATRNGPNLTNCGVMYISDWDAMLREKRSGLFKGFASTQACVTHKYWGRDTPAGSNCKQQTWSAKGMASTIDLVLLTAWFISMIPILGMAITILCGRFTIEQNAMALGPQPVAGLQAVPLPCQPVMGQAIGEPLQPGQMATGGDLVPALPLGWTHTVDPNSGQTYFVNSVTNETSWTVPVHDANSTVPTKV